MNKKIMLSRGFLLFVFIFAIFTIPAVSATVDELFEMGKQAYKNKEYTEAYNYFKQVVTANPDIAKYQYNLGLAARKLNQYAEAYDAFNKAKELDPSIGFTGKPDDFWQKLAEMKQKTGGEAVTKPEQPVSPVKTAPNIEATLLALSHMELFEQGVKDYKSRYFDSAYKYLQAAVAKDPFNAKYQYNLGLAARKLNRFEEAFEAFSKAKELDPAMEFTTKPDEFLKKLEEARKNSSQAREKSNLALTGTTPVAKDKGGGFPLLPVVIGGIIVFLIIVSIVRRKRARAALAAMAAGTPGIPGTPGTPGTPVTPGSGQLVSPYGNNIKYTVHDTGKSNVSRHQPHDSRYDDVRYYDDPVRSHSYRPATGGPVHRHDRS